MNVKNWLNNNELSMDIFNKKYRHEDETFNEWLIRVSGGSKDIAEAIGDKKFLFAGRILANRGLHKLGKKITYSNCYVVTPPEDNLESIFDAAKKLARTYSYGGGCGVDISKLRPEGSSVNNAARETSGATSFMDLYDKTTEIIGQNGRRGALMISIDVSHPDIRKFIGIKSDLKRITKANISVKVDNEFMIAVRDNKDYELTFTVKDTKEVISETIKARDLFMELVKQNHNYAEPGILFWDTIKDYHILQHDTDFEFAGTNPCAEEPLPAGGSCLLGSIILPSFVTRGVFDFDEFSKIVRLGVRSLNEVLDEGLELHPLEEQRKSVGDWRQIGLGVLGVGDMLIMLGLKYDTQEAIDFCDRVGFVMADTALAESAIMAGELGAYPNFKTEAVSKSSFIASNVSIHTANLIDKYGLRNSQLLTIAPTGSLGTMLEISTGVEPNFAFSYNRKTESLHGEDVSYEVASKITEGYDLDNLPEHFVSAQNIDPIMRIKMQGAWQKHIDASISSTVNLPNSATEQDVYDIYMKAWEEGLKGCTVYRDGCAREGILTLGDKEEEVEALPRGQWKKLAEDTVYRPKKIKIGCGKLKLFIGYSESEGCIQDFYIKRSGQGGCVKNIEGMVICMSGMLRLGGNVENVEKAFMGIEACNSFVLNRAKGVELSKGGNCPSAILNAIKEFELEIAGQPIKKVVAPKKVDREVDVVVNVSKAVCPECGEELSFTGGCSECKSCGFTHCS